MRDTKELLRETRDRIAPPLDVLGSLERRRHHREQVRRGSAAVVAIVIALVGLGGWFVIGRDAAKVPVDDPSPNDLGIFAPVAGRIVYGDILGREPGIWAMDPANPDAEPVLLDRDAGIPLAWSSDGSKLLISRDDSSGSGSAELVVLKGDGNATHLAEVRNSGESGGSFTPDGSQVVYGWRSGIYSVDVDGGSRRLLYESSEWAVFAPALSPDGSQVAFYEGGADWGNSLWVMNVDGTDKHLILGEGQAGRTPFSVQWSPDGTRLVFSRGGEDRSFGVVNADGSGLSFVDAEVSEMGPGAGPYWSPDGTHLAFATGPWRAPSLAISRPDGTELREFSGGRAGPWNPLDPSSTTTQTDGSTQSTPTASREGGEFLVFTPRATGAGWDLGAQHPETGEVRTIVETDGIVDCAERATRRLCDNFIRKAEWSADGRWVAFEVTNASLDGPALGPCLPTIGIWVHGPNGVPRQLTTPCDDPGSGSNDPVEALWEWSPAHTALAYVRIDGENDELFLIDPSDGTRTSLGTGTMDPTNTTQASKLVWSPDGTQIAYADGSSVFAIDVDGGDRSLLADSFADIIDIAWSPDGAQILVHDQGRYRIQVMNADGSDLHVVLEGEDACCETAWSPSGDRIVYMLSTGASEVWTVAPDGSDPIEIYRGCGDSLPVWAPTGTQVAYRGCDGWVVENADGTGDVRTIDRLVWRSWSGGGLSGSDLAGIGQLHH